MTEHVWYEMNQIVPVGAVDEVQLGENGSILLCGSDRAEIWRQNNGGDLWELEFQFDSYQSSGRFHLLQNDHVLETRNERTRFWKRKRSREWVCFQMERNSGPLIAQVLQFANNDIVAMDWCNDIFHWAWLPGKKAWARREKISAARYHKSSGNLQKISETDFFWSDTRGEFKLFVFGPTSGRWHQQDTSHLGEVFNVAYIPKTKTIKLESSKLDGPYDWHSLRKGESGKWEILHTVLSIWGTTFYFPDGTRMMPCNWQHKFRWSTFLEEKLCWQTLYEVHDQRIEIHHMQVSPQGDLCVSADNDGHLAVWEQNQEGVWFVVCFFYISLRFGLPRITFTPDNTIVFLDKYSQVTFWQSHHAAQNSVCCSLMSILSMLL